MRRSLTTSLHSAFAVARIDEALALRAGGLTKPIVLLEGFFHMFKLANIDLTDKSRNILIVFISGLCFSNRNLI